MSESAFFKVKSSKRSNPEARTTLDAIHHQKIQSMMEEKEKVGKYKQEQDVLKKKMSETISDMEIWRVEREIEILEKKIRSIEDGSEMMDYYLRTGDILYHYYDIQDQIQQGTANFVSNKAKPGSILASLEEVAEDEHSSTNTFALSSSENEQRTEGSKEKKSFQRNQLLNDYLQIEDPSMGRNTMEEYDDPWTNCESCGNDHVSQRSKSDML